MAEIVQKSYNISPTQRFVDAEGRLTQKGFEVMKAVSQILEAVNVMDGEITTEKLADLAVQASKLDDGAVVIGKLAAGSIHVSTLFADEVVITSKVAQNAITDITVATQGTAVGPGGVTVTTANVPIVSTDNTGVLINFTAYADRPSSDPSNFGYWGYNLYRNGVLVSQSPSYYYDDNFSYPTAVTWVDYSPGADPEYEIRTRLDSGPGTFLTYSGVAAFSLFKR